MSRRMKFAPDDNEGDQFFGEECSREIIEELDAEHLDLERKFEHHHCDNLPSET